MKKILFIVVIIGISLQGYAQDELNTKYKPIPPKPLEVQKKPPPKEPKPNIEPPVVEKKKDTLQVNPDELFKDSTLYKKENNSEGIYYRKNQYLGSFKTKTIEATISFRDAAFVDGDKIKVYLNDKVIEPEITMQGEFQGIKVKLATGVNKIDFEALNEGFASPNTAEFKVYDDKGTVIASRQWNVGTGYKATIILVKE